MHPDNLLSWGYWLKHHCVCVYGEDLSQRFQAFKPSKEIAVAVNGDFLPVLEKLITQMQLSADENKKLQLQRAAARKAIRATNILRSEHDKQWPETLEEYRFTFNARYPALAKEMDYLLAISNTPQGASLISKSALWLLPDGLTSHFITGRVYEERINIGVA